MAEFIPAAGGSFLDRFKRRYSAQEVDMYQKGAANNYGQTFELVEREFEKALDSDTVPEGFNGDVDAWNQFRTEQKNKPATFFPDMTDIYKVLGKDTTNRFFAGTDLGSKLLDNPDDPETQKKNLNLDKTEEFVDPETGETRYAPAVDTYNVGEGGAVSGRTNEITDDGKPQNETQKFGFNNLSKDEFNAMVETARLAKLKEGGIYSESFVQGDELFRELSTDGTLDAALVGDRSKVIDTVKRVENLKKGLKGRGLNITEGEQEQSTSPQMSGESLIDVGSYDVTDDQIRELTAGYTRKGQGQSGRTKSIGAKQTSLTNALISDRDIIKNLSSKQLNKREKTTLANAQKRFDAGVTEAKNFDLRTDLRTNLESLQGDNKTKYGTLLAKTNFDLIAKNPVLRNELKNTSPEEFLQKYTKEDGTLDKEKLYGNQFSGDAAKVLDKNISDKKVDELFTAIEDGDQEKVTSILASVNISDEDQQKLLAEVQKTGGDYRRETDVNRKRKLYFATLGSLVPGSALYNTLTSPNNAISNMIESGMINNSGLDAMSKQLGITSAQRSAENLSDLYKNYLNNFDNVKKDFDLNDNSTMSNIEDYFEKQSSNYNDMTNWIRSGRATRTDKIDYLSKTLGVLKDINQAQQPGFWKELFTLGFAKGPNMNLFGTEIDIQLSRDKTTNKVNGLIIGDSVFSPEELRGQGFSQTVIDQLIAAGDDNTTTTQGN